MVCEWTTARDKNFYSALLLDFRNPKPTNPEPNATAHTTQELGTDLVEAAYHLRLIFP
jgi:hypothetical protein